MKKLIILFSIVLYSVSITGYAQAEEGGVWPPFVKIGRGISNVMSAPLELPKNIGDANKSDGIFAGLTWGILQGVADTIGRIVVGAYEVITFPFPIPEDYKPILTEPEYFLQDGRL